MFIVARNLVRESLQLHHCGVHVLIMFVTQPCNAYCICDMHITHWKYIFYKQCHFHQNIMNSYIHTIILSKSQSCHRYRKFRGANVWFQFHVWRECFYPKHGYVQNKYISARQRIVQQGWVRPVTLTQIVVRPIALVGLTGSVICSNVLGIQTALIFHQYHKGHAKWVW